MPNKEKISAEKKVQIVREYLSNRIGIAEAARRVGADEETVKGWVNRYENEGTSGFIDKENRTYNPQLSRLLELKIPTVQAAYRSPYPQGYSAGTCASRSAAERRPILQ